MYAEGHTVTDAKKLPLNLLDAIREYDGDAALKEMMGAEFSSAFVKMKTQEWNSYMGHFSDWEKANALDI
jgi:glutamine synthetase